jgi:glycosyltransferase involved in cell wall biosynthesis
MALRRMVAVCPVVPWPPADGGRKRTMRLLEAAERVGLVPHLLTADHANVEGPEILRERGWRVELLEPPPGDLKARLKQQYDRLPSPYQPAVERRLRQLVAAEPTLVLIEHTQSAYYAEALAGTPWILSTHNVDSQLMCTLAEGRRPLSRAWLREWNRWHAMRTVERRAGAAATAVLCVSENDRRTFGQVNDHVVLSPNGVDDDFFTATPAAERQKLKVLFFGRLDYEPNELGFERFLREGWPLLHQRRPDAVLRLVGGGAPPALKAAAKAAPGVEVVGFVDDLVAEIASCDVLVVPLWAGGGTRLKVLEAMAAAIPIVGTSLGVEEIGFEDDVHGLIRDTPELLAAGADELLTDRARAHRLAAAGRTLAEDFRWSKALAPAETLFRDLGEGRSGVTAVR